MNGILHIHTCICTFKTYLICKYVYTRVIRCSGRNIKWCGVASRGADSEYSVANNKVDDGAGCGTIPWLLLVSLFIHNPLAIATCASPPMVNIMRMASWCQREHGLNSCDNASSFIYIYLICDCYLLPDATGYLLPDTMYLGAHSSMSQCCPPLITFISTCRSEIKN